MMRILMLGWEFPPYLSGGLGTACFGMTEALVRKGTHITFVLPKAPSVGKDPLSGVDLRSASGTTLHTSDVVPGISSVSRSSTVETQVHTLLSHAARDLWSDKLDIRRVDSLIQPYETEETYMAKLLRQKTGTAITETSQVISEQSRKFWEKLHSVSKTTVDHTETIQLHGGYGKDLMSEVERFSRAAAAIALKENFDVIHVHDWMTYPAGILIKELTGKPLVCHSHALEHDRSGDNVNTEVARIEQIGLNAADKVVAVSYYTKEEIERFYGVPADHIEVVHNAVSRSENPLPYHVSMYKAPGEKLVLFMGRITFQKGPEYFIEAAHQVLKQRSNVRFVMAGSGDMMNRMVSLVAKLRMGDHFHFTGFLSGAEVDTMYAMSDLYVMPSVSEPFGIAPLEAMLNDIPVIISRQSGVAEVVRNALKVDFWDVREMANKICAVLDHQVLADEMVRNCREELRHIRWDHVADRLNEIYSKMCGSHAAQA